MAEDEGQVTLELPTSSQRYKLSEERGAGAGVGGESPNNRQYNNFGGGDTLINKLPAVIADKFWYIAAVLIVCHATAMLVTFSVAVAGLKKSNDVEDEVGGILQGEVKVLMGFNDRLKHLEKPRTDCNDTGWINSAYATCLYISREKKNYENAKTDCETQQSSVAFPRDALEFSILKSMALMDPGSGDTPTFLGIMRDSTTSNWHSHGSLFNTSQPLESFWDAGEPAAAAGDCAAIVLGDSHHNKMVTHSCTESAYFICGKKIKD